MFYQWICYVQLQCILSLNFASYAKTQENFPASYEGAQVWRSNLNDEKDIPDILKLVADGAISIWNLDYSRADFLVYPQDRVTVNRYLNAKKLNHSVLIIDVQRRIDAFTVETSLWNEKSLNIGHRLNWKEYPTLKVIDEYYNYLTEHFPSICKVENIGLTAENRTIKMARISNGNPANKAILISAGSHAHEWISITSALYVLDKVINNFDRLSNYMKSIDWLIVPVLNPDGYEYTQTHDRLWRKNRRKIGVCKGVDITKNFDIDFDVDGAEEKNECLEGYSGPRPFSEAETQALRDMIVNIPKKPIAMIDLHSYGQLILYPWSARPTPTPDRSLLWSTAKKMAESIYNNTETTYRVGSSHHMRYPVTGAAIDWAYYSGIGLSYAVELGDDGGHGFLLPAEYIEPSGKELFVALKEMFKGRAAEFRTRKADPWF